MSLPKLLVAVAIAALAAAALTLVPCSTRADDETAITGGLRIAEVSATPARAGEMAVLTFSVENVGTDPVRITGARLPHGEQSRVMGSFSSSVTGEIDAVRVDPGVTERLDEKTIWIEVGPLARDLAVDTVIPAKLLLGGYDAPISVHVGLPATSGIVRESLVRARDVEPGDAGC
jgi:hypothetical protein